MSALILAALLLGPCPSTPLGDAARSIAAPSPSPATAAARPGPAGLYIEARTASLLAGACHYNSELVTSGGEALLAWSFERGSREGVDLAGTRVAAVVVADRNFALEGARSSSVLYVDGPTAAGRAAAVAEVRARHAAILGRVRAQEQRALAVERSGERYAVAIEGVAALDGLLLADRECCTMPLARWYAPLSTVETSIVGNSARFEHAAGRWIERSWRRAGHNDAQVGRFAW